MSFGLDKAYKAGSLSSIQYSPPSARRSEDNLLIGSYENILARSYNLFRNSSIPSGISTTLTNYIGGSGLTPINIPTEAADFWKQWANNSNISGTRGMEQDYRDIIAAQVESGDVLITTITDRTIPQEFIRTKIHLIAGARVRTPGFKKEDKTVVMGVKFSPQGKELGYWVSKLEKSTGVDKEEDFTFIPKRDKKTGRFISHLLRKPNKMTPGQTRGLPIITPIIQELEDIASLWDAAINGANTKALLSVMLQIENPDDFYGATKARNDTDSLQEFSDNHGLTNPVGTIDPNTVTLVPPGTTPVQISHTGNMDLDVLFHRINLYISTSLGIPYEILFKDFSKTNFSSGKIGLDSFYRMSDMWTNSNSRVFTEIFRLIIREGELKGLIGSQDLSGLRWIGPARVDIDPGKNSKAETERLMNGITTQTELLADKQMTLEDHLNIVKKEEELRNKMGMNQEELQDD